MANEGEPQELSDVWTQRIVTLGMVLIAQMSVVAVVVLVVSGNEVPPVLGAMGGASIGAMAGLLPSRLPQRKVFAANTDEEVKPTALAKKERGKGDGEPI